MGAEARENMRHAVAGLPSFLMCDPWPAPHRSCDNGCLSFASPRLTSAQLTSPHFTNAYPHHRQPFCCSEQSGRRGDNTTASKESISININIINTSNKPTTTAPPPLPPPQPQPQSQQQHYNDDAAPAEYRQTPLRAGPPSPAEPGILPKRP